eukprot:CAMPEP_0179449762 /NCGR_PEP_ID=MMETSP0799-20121207/33630_1 /TAXON_ID=46947 /ORGANISM="Geminigera cryophila, Strain CCMP2564" /LENGTH=253 /DNA_ID=CAMNT_0021242973 /DNA_START=79 /DNA_END=840 /DNA_ORIENTATION=-
MLHSQPIEIAVALCLAAAKMLVPAHILLRNNDWSARGIPAEVGKVPQPMSMMILAGKTCLVMGYGEVGRRVAVAMKALGMHVLATRATGTAVATTAEGISVHPAKKLHSLLPRVHVLFICVPSTLETDGMISSVELDLLPKGAVLVNVGRGAVVDEQALYCALSPGGSLMSAGVDVWYNYPANHSEITSTPPSRKCDFSQLDNLVMSPHRGGGVGVKEAEDARLDMIAASLVSAGSVGRVDAMPSRINLEKGY